MSTQIKLTIASDGERCGDCDNFSTIGESPHYSYSCNLFDDEDVTDGLRCQACLDAEVGVHVFIPEQTEEDKDSRVLRGMTVSIPIEGNIVEDDPMIHMRMSELEVHINNAMEAVVNRRLDTEVKDGK